MLNNWQRIERVVRWAGLSVNSFALSVGLSRGENLYQIKRGKNGISPQLARTIVARYPQISCAWLLTGEGDMFAVGATRQNSVPFYDTDIEKYIAQPTRYSSEACVSLPDIDDADFAARYHGKAMGDAVPAGAIVLVKKIAPEGLVPGGDYIVVGEGLTMLRRVRRRVESNVLRLTPVDTDNFDEICIDAAEVKELYAVRAVIINKTV